MRPITLIVSCCLLACAPAEQNSAPGASNDSSLSAVRAEFSERLATVHGTLQSLEAQGGTIKVTWNAVHCEAPEGEITDLLLSLKQGHPGALTGNIEAERVCDGVTRTFTTTAARFEQYRSGRINDAEMLKGLK